MLLLEDPQGKGSHTSGRDLGVLLQDYRTLRLAGDDPVSIIGGADIFAQFLPIADRIELTEVLANVEGDTFMPDPRDGGGWRETWSEDHPAEGDRPPLRFVRLEKR